MGRGSNGTGERIVVNSPITLEGLIKYNVKKTEEGDWIFCGIKSKTRKTAVKNATKFHEKYGHLPWKESSKILRTEWWK